MSETIADMAAASPPPHCLHELVAKQVRDSERPDAVRYELSCRCGHQVGRLLGYDFGVFESDGVRGAFLDSPLTYECAACHQRYVFFDKAQHGYDAECGLPVVLEAGEPSIATCLSCGRDEFRLTADFSYQYEPSELADWPKEMAERLQDYFDSFGVDGECQSCGTIGNLAAFELA